MPTFTRFNQFIEDVFKKKHDFSADTFKYLLTNTAPSLGNTVKTDITEIANGNGYTAGGTVLGGVTAEQVAGVLTVTANDVIIAAAGGSMAAWRYLAVFNDTSVGDLLVGYADRGSAITLGAGESETMDFTTGTMLTA
jgi:hypothetical protein